MLSNLRVGTRVQQVEYELPISDPIDNLLIYIHRGNVLVLQFDKIRLETINTLKVLFGNHLNMPIRIL